jgi:DNA-binding transcriptional ArsR family regulator
MDIFHAIAEPTRRDIIELIAINGQLSATDICNNFSISHPAISQHLKVLREANLVLVERRAQQRIYRINSKKMLEVEKWAKQMTRIWDERFDALDHVLMKEKKKMMMKNSKKR